MWKALSKNIQQKKSYGINTIWLLLDKVLSLSTVLFITILLPKYLAVDEYGLLNYALSFVMIFASFCNLGLNNILFMDLVNRTLLKTKLLNSAFFLISINSLLVFTLCLTVSYFSSNNQETFLIIFIMSFHLLFTPFIVFEVFFQSRLKSKYIVISRVFSQLFSLVALSGFLYFEASIIYFGFYKLIEFSIFATLIFIFAKKFISLELFRYTRILNKHLISRSLPIFLQSIMVVIMLKIDQIFVKHYLGETANGIYALSIRLSEFWYFVPMAIVTSLFPTIIKIKNQNESVYKKRILMLYISNIAISFIFIAAVYFFMPIFINFYFEESFHQSIETLRILIFAGFFVCLGLVTSRWLLVESWQRYLGFGAFLAALTNIVINFIVIKDYGLLGVAYSSLISYALGSFFFLFLFKKSRIFFLSLFKLKKI